MTSPKEPIPKAIEPRYSFGPNRPTRVFSGLIRAVVQGRSIQAPGVLEIGWFPSPRSRFRMDAFVGGMGDFELFVRGATAPTIAGLTDARETFPKGASYTAGELHHQMRRGHKDGLASMTFHVANFPEYRGHPVARRRIDRARLSLSTDGWDIDLDCVAGISQTMKFLRTQGGYALTHVGSLQRSDETLFAAADGQEVVESLASLLSFARSASCWPFEMVGLDANGRAIWRTYDQPNVAVWKTELRWFTPREPDRLALVFSGLRRRWRVPQEREILQRAIYLHNDASTRGVEPGLIVAQAALELLAWQVLVNERQAISADGFSGLTASDQLRLLLTSCDIPLAIPDSLTELIAYSKATACADGPEAMTRIRNRWAHPPRKGSLRPVGPEQSGAWQLALWYLDLVLLHWFGYVGPYTPRVAPLSVEQVPWS